MDEMILLDPSKGEAKVYYDYFNHRQRHVYMVKVSFKDAGVHINSITVQPSYKDPTKPWVQSPRFNIRGRWVWPLQFEKAATLWPVIEKLALKAVADYSGNEVESIGGAFVERESEFL